MSIASARFPAKSKRAKARREAPSSAKSKKSPPMRAKAYSAPTSTLLVLGRGERWGKRRARPGAALWKEKRMGGKVAQAVRGGNCFLFADLSSTAETRRAQGSDQTLMDHQKLVAGRNLPGCWRSIGEALDVSVVKLLRPVRLFAVLVLQEGAHFVFQAGIVAVYGGAQGGFGGAAFGNAPQDANQVIHAVGVTNIFGCGERLIVGQAGFGRAEMNEAAVHQVEGQGLMADHELSQAASEGGRGARLQQLGNAFVQPLRTAAGAELIDEGVRQLMFEHAGELGRYIGQAADRNAQLAIVDGVAPSGRLGDIKKLLLGVEHHGNAVAGLGVELGGKVVIVRFQQ